jgi:nicotinate-nucleotide adenylyltransferase
MTALKVGLLGGSFNPAHDGHRYISQVALRLLGLDQVWWLVSPQNPLKPSGGMAEYDERLASARCAARDPRIQISDFEKKLGQAYTAKTIAALKIRYPDPHFVWLMGADNLIQFPSWHQWEKIMQMVPVAVFNRPGYTYQALNGLAAHKYRANRLTGRHGTRFLQQLATKPAPCWAFVAETTHKLSSTTLRNFRDNAGNACS